MYKGLLFLALLLASCGESPDEDISTILGPYTATGSITATGTSLYRRGTHVLLINGKSRFYLESKDIDLNQYQKGEVVVEGEVLPNTHERFLPIFHVQSAHFVSEETSSLQEYTAENMELSLSAPREWRGSLQKGALAFQVPEEEMPFLMVERTTLALPEGLHVRVDGHNGMRTVNQGTHRIFVKRSDDIILFTFSPQGEKSLELRDAFYALLKTVRFAKETPKEEPDDEGMPCGGSAGVLCPEGEYCSVKEIDTGIGVCKTVGS